jgi:hypothetical protein
LAIRYWHRSEKRKIEEEKRKNHPTAVLGLATRY